MVFGLGLLGSAAALSAIAGGGLLAGWGISGWARPLTPATPAGPLGVDWTMIIIAIIVIAVLYFLFMRR